MLFLFGWPPCQRSDMTLIEVSQRALDSLHIRNIWLLYILLCFFVNLIWYLYLFWLNKHCLSLSLSLYEHDDFIKWKHFPRYWPFVRKIHLSPVNSPHKGQWRGALMFSLICVRINGWVNNGKIGDLRRYRANYVVFVMISIKISLKFLSMCPINNILGVVR